MSKTKALFNLTQAAKILGIPYSKAWHLVQEGVLKPSKVGGVYQMPAEELVRFLVATGMDPEVAKAYVARRLKEEGYE